MPKCGGSQLLHFSEIPELRRHGAGQAVAVKLPARGPPEQGGEGYPRGTANARRVPLLGAAATPDPGRRPPAARIGVSRCGGSQPLQFSEIPELRRQGAGQAVAGKIPAGGAQSWGKVEGFFCARDMRVGPADPRRNADPTRRAPSQRSCEPTLLPPYTLVVHGGCGKWSAQSGAAEGAVADRRHDGANGASCGASS